jgi:transposase
VTDGHPLPVPHRYRSPEPDPRALRRLYVSEGRTEREIAQVLSISREQVAEAMARAGIERRTTRRICPVDPVQLTELYRAPGATVSQLARRFDVAHATAERWLADAGLLSPDPGIDPVRLAKLYLDDGLTVREVAEKLGTSRARVQQGLAAAGIPARSNRSRRPQQRRAKVTNPRLADLYVRQGMSVVECARRLGVSTEYLRKRLTEAGLAKRPGTYTPHTGWRPDDQRDRAADLYQQGLSMRVVGEQLDVSVSTVRKALHEAQVPVRRGGARSSLEEARTLIDDIYADRQVVKVLVAHGVVIPDGWTPTGPFESLAPLPLSRSLVKTLYGSVGLPLLHIALLLGVGVGSVKSALVSADVLLRPPSQPAPWTTRRYSG